MYIFEGTRVSSTANIQNKMHRIQDKKQMLLKPNNKMRKEQLELCKVNERNYLHMV